MFSLKTINQLLVRIQSQFFLFQMETIHFYIVTTVLIPAKLVERRLTPALHLLKGLNNHTINMNLRYTNIQK